MGPNRQGAMSRQTANSTSPPVTADPRWRQRLLFLAAILLVGGALLARILGAASSGSAFAEAERLAARMGVDTKIRPIPWDRVDLILEGIPATASQPATRRLADLAKGSDVLVVNFWATWCPPCLDELPSLVALADGLRGRDVAFVAISYDDDWDAQAAVIERLVGRSWPDSLIWLRDPQGQGGDESKTLRFQLGTRKLPETWVIRGGEVIAGFIGPQRWDRPEVQRYFSLITRERK